ncbi:uncharacterized protein LOC114522600 [Dendronephthya gigantea]|uniref:uncharacterized protein LOC114522600 n=1 Tax=Dendronephthya gigantea TaxID=151771 RepID=UPI00106D78ED|nr:uncharacterized protein LOC114522600 [Dendronephthya gigantea]
MVKQRIPKIHRLKNGYLRSWRRTRIFTLILVVFGITQVAFVITWHYRAPISKRDVFRVRHVKKDIGSVINNQRKLKVFNEFKGTPDQLLKNLKSGFGGQIKIEYSVPRDAENITFEYSKASFPRKIQFSKVDPKVRAQKPAGYVRVFGQYWEQMTMNLRNLISLVGQAKIGNRKVLEPKVKDSGFGRDGKSLGLYFDLKHFNDILVASDYATMANQNEYNRECPLASKSHVTIHFLYSQKGIDFTKQKLKLNDKQYKDISAKASKSGWTECKALTNFIKESSNSKQFCVDPSKYTTWDKLEKEVLKGAKCVTISHWRGIGGGYRTYFSENAFKIKARDIQFALKPPVNIAREADRFQNHYLHGRFIAVQVRGERVVIPHNLKRLGSCLRILADVVSMLKELSDITHVFVASDMSNFGSGSWKGSLKGEVYNDNTLKDLNSFLISSTGGIEYKPPASDVDRGVVALVEMALIERAQHLITIGMGSFQEWIKAKFLEKHRDEGRPSWSLITMCSK